LRGCKVRVVDDPEAFFGGTDSYDAEALAHAYPQAAQRQGPSPGSIDI
jgi:hypothetical protein